ncbi:GTPase HflX [Limnochorda pilosa]|uniref:GTPase HflX n=1 Tax=Limnochorda pilosa TaxID=1555112 RepID=A0A0K2SPK3_LIMPI|nr:GTPase HflX [Limnochorda pilosa]BAS28932.1 GTPase HflX [Limnochorda pilosa]
MQLRETVILAGLKEADNPMAGSLFRELGSLVEAAGGEVAGEVTSSRRRPHPATLIGPGKVEDLQAMVVRTGADLVVFNDELSPAQARNLSAALKCRVIDRTQLILDIFAQRARSREGKLQVERAQLEYLLPRLGGTVEELSRLGGGIGTRGPGETQLERDRRRVRRRLARLRRELASFEGTRRVQRATRQQHGIPLVALVGYTNAGKSTLFNRLTGAGVTAGDRLFETLDPTLRRLRLGSPPGDEVILADTVGFLRRLPHRLVAAFHATLEEVVEADLLLHVVDASDPEHPQQMQAVQAVLRELGTEDKPHVVAFNKVDRLGGRRPLAMRMEPHAVAISALEGRGLDALQEEIRRCLPERLVVREYRFPYGAAGLVAWFHRGGRVLEEEYGPEEIRLRVELRESLAREAGAVVGARRSQRRVPQ